MEEHPLSTVDVRHSSRFRPERFPTAGQNPFPGGSIEDPRLQRQLGFLNAYYHLNCAYADLQEHRSTHGNGGEAHEHALLQEIEKALLEIESLEAHYRKIGMIASPVQVDGFVNDVEFHDAVSVAEMTRRSPTLSSSGCFAIPGLAQLDHSGRTCGD